MTELAGQNILIVAGASSAIRDFKQKLVKHGATVHVISTPDQAVQLARQKRIDTAILSYSEDPGLCNELGKLGVRQIYLEQSGLVETAA